jgi:hypothetical protein
MSNNKYETIGKYKIFFEEMYYIAYAGGKRELAAKDQKNWDRTLSLPGLLQKREQVKLGWKNNPNVVPIKGSKLISFIRELGYVPFFDQYFSDGSNVLKLTDLVIYEAIKKKSYEL